MCQSYCVNIYEAGLERMLHQMPEPFVQLKQIS